MSFPPALRRPRHLLEDLAMGATIAVATGLVVSSAAPVPASALALPSTGTSATTFYVSPTGSDAAAGTSPATAWRTLARASAAGLGAGGALLLERNGVWDGELRVTSSGTALAPITVGGYGTGAAPTLTGSCLAVSGSWVVVDGVTTSGCAYAGMSLSGTHITVRNSVSSHNVSGIQVGQSATDAVIEHNQLIDNNRMAANTPGSNDDYGAFGIELLGDRARVAWNTISGSHASSADYGSDGSAVEVYGSNGSVIDHNISIDNQTFTELGKAQTRNTSFSFNAVRSSLEDATFLVTRGLGDSFGPVWAVRASRNTALLTGARSQAFWCGGTCGVLSLDLVGNILQAQGRVGFGTPDLTGWSFGGGDNIYWGGPVEYTMLPGDRVVDPGFASTTTLQLAADSPAIDTGLPLPVTQLPLIDLDSTTDVLGNPTPVDGNGDRLPLPDVGAVEYQPTG